MTRRNCPKAGPTAAAATAALLACMQLVPAAALAHAAVPQAAAHLPQFGAFRTFLDPPVIIVENAIVTGPADPETEFEQLQLGTQEAELGSSRVGTGRGLLHGVRKPRDYPVCSKCALVSCRSRTKCSGHCKRKGRLYTCKTSRTRSPFTLARRVPPPVVTAEAPFIACMRTTDCELPTNSLARSVDGAALVSAGETTFAECVLHDSRSAGACLCTFATTGAATMARFCETESGQGAPEVSNSFTVRDELEVTSGNQTVTVLFGFQSGPFSPPAPPEFQAGEEAAAADAVVTTVDEEFGGDYSLEDYSADPVEYELMESLRRSSFLGRVSTVPSRPLMVEEEDQAEEVGEGGDDGVGTGAVAAAPPPARSRVEEPPEEGAANGQAGADVGMSSEQRVGGEPAVMGSGAPKRMRGGRPARASKNRSTRTPKQGSTPPSKRARTTSRNAARGRGGGKGQGSRGRATVGKSARGGSARPARGRKTGRGDKAGGSTDGGKTPKGERRRGEGQV